jgi:hypothetical protein
MTGQEGSGMLGCVGQGFYGPTGARRFPQREPSPFEFMSQFDDRPTASEELTVRASRTERPSQLGASEQLGDVQFERHPTRRTLAFRPRHGPIPR